MNCHMNIGIPPNTFVALRNTLACVLAIYVGFHLGNGYYEVSFSMFGILYAALDLLWIILIATKWEFLLCLLAVTLAQGRFAFDQVIKTQPTSISEGNGLWMFTIAAESFVFSLIASLLISAPIHLWRRFRRDVYASSSDALTKPTQIVDLIKIFALVFCLWWFLHP